MKASFLDLRRRMNDVLRAIDKNEAVILTYRGKEKCVMYPVRKTAAKSVASHPAFGMWKDRQDIGDVNELVDKLRRGRSHVV